MDDIIIVGKRPSPRWEKRVRNDLEREIAGQINSSQVEKVLISEHAIQIVMENGVEIQIDGEQSDRDEYQLRVEISYG